MNKGKYVFSQLLSFLDPFVFLRISKKYGGDKYVKTFSCWNQLAVMMFGQLLNRDIQARRQGICLNQMTQDRNCFLGIQLLHRSDLALNQNNIFSRHYSLFGRRGNSRLVFYCRRIKHTTPSIRNVQHCSISSNGKLFQLPVNLSPITIWNLPISPSSTPTCPLTK